MLYLNHDGSYKNSPNWIKTKKTKKNPVNDGDKCFQYALIFINQIMKNLKASKKNIKN